MYAGKVVEEAPIQDLFEHPLHPYTEGLLLSVPAADADIERLEAIDGTVPSPFDMPKGCPFHPRCRWARDACMEGVPELLPLRPDHAAACIRHVDYRPAATAEAAVGGNR
jgi:oligopeptide/dipeptide ABC transporter ATP-binding protein